MEIALGLFVIGFGLFALYVSILDWSHFKQIQQRTPTRLHGRGAGKIGTTEYHRAGLIVLGTAMVAGGVTTMVLGPRWRIVRRV